MQVLNFNYGVLSHFVFSILINSNSYISVIDYKKKILINHSSLLSMSDLKTKPTDQNVEEYLNKVENPTKREDSFKILKLMREVSNEEPIMWGDSIIGFGSYHYKYKSGREGDLLVTGFAPRKQNLTLYIMSGFDRHEDLLKKLGKYKTGKSCLYINKLKDVDTTILREIVSKSIEFIRKGEIAY